MLCTSSRRYSPTSLSEVALGTGIGLGHQVTHAWWNTMIDVGFNFLVSTVDLAVTPNP